LSDSIDKLIHDAATWGYGYQRIPLPGGREIPGHDRSGIISAAFDTFDAKGKTVLDIGCYIGALTFEAARRGAKATGIDVSHGRIECANKIEAVLQTGAHFEVGRWPEYAKGKGRWDCILAINVLHHFKFVGHMLSVLLASRERVFLELPEFKSGKWTLLNIGDVPFHRRAHQSALHRTALIPVLSSLGRKVICGRSQDCKGPRWWYDCR